MTEPRFHAWLDKHRDLRMDANSELFRESRRKLHLDRYQFAKPHCAKKVVLDAACGTGYGSEILADSATRLVGIDCDKGAIEYASRHYRRENAEFHVAYVEATEFGPGAFDVVVSFETVEHTLCPN